ncbi:FAD linked oxidase N-terminal [Penicillium herquei]|nr:FAD linked oxidase N-terminal [Penicillium herquei]
MLGAALRSTVLQGCMAAWLMGQTCVASLSTSSSVSSLAGSTNANNSFASTCRKLPQDGDWPSAQDWARLNQTVGGRLIATVPVAHVCHDPTYNATACAWFKDNWLTVEAHVYYPAEILDPYFQGQYCEPFTPESKPCTLGNYAVYSINVTGVSDIQAGLAFATQHDVRLTIKNTGHDLLGKSTGRGALSLWTHNLKDMDFIDAYVGDVPYTGSAVRIGAGIMFNDILPVAAAQGKRVVSGTCGTVGAAGGYTAGGGHGSLTSLYGMAADSVLEWEVVTASGVHLTVTPKQNADLYWALSGGGAGTFAVVVSMTTRTYDDGPMQGAGFTVSNSNTTAFWNTVDLFHSSLAPVVDTGVTFTYFILGTELIVFAAVIPGSEPGLVTSTLAPIVNSLAQAGVTVNITSSSFSSYYALYESYFVPTEESTAVGQITGGRIIPRELLEPASPSLSEISAALEVFINAGFYVACAALNANSSRQAPFTSNAVFPVWRSALLTCIMVQTWDYSIPWDENLERQTNLTSIYMPQLEAVTPGGGAYLNEANFQEPNWQEVFYGDNYPRLNVVKQKYDPNELFYARTAVGSEKWKENGEGRLCPV